jgi:hypothetical protein
MKKNFLIYMYNIFFRVIQVNGFIVKKMKKKIVRIGLKKFPSIALRFNSMLVYYLSPSVATYNHGSEPMVMQPLLEIYLWYFSHMPIRLGLVLFFAFKKTIIAKFQTVQGHI